MKNKPYQDERKISWKILIPHNPNAKILAIGLNEGCLKGLLRTWSNIDCFNRQDANFTSDKAINGMSSQVNFYSSVNNLNSKYDIIVIADNTFAKQRETSRISKLLSDNGVLVLMKYCGGDINKSILQNSYFTQLNYYSALPQNSPRMLIPLKNYKSRNKGLSFHTPGSLVARTLYNGVKVASRMGFKFHLSKKPLIIAYRSQADEKELLTNFLSKLIDTEINDLIIYTGSDQSKRKTTAFAVVKKKTGYVIKISDTAKGCNAIKQENEALNILNTTDLSCHVPDLIVELTNWQGYNLQVQSEMSLNINKQTPELTEQHYNFLAVMSFIDRKTIKLNKTETYKNLIKKLRVVDLNKCSSSVKKSINIIMDPYFAKKETVCHRTHGDFTPWNIKLKGHQFFVVDWEDSLSDGLVLTDIFHFIFRQAALIGPWQGSSILLGKIRNAANRFTAKTNFEKFDYSTVLLVWIMTEYSNNRSKYIEELINSFIDSWEE